MGRRVFPDVNFSEKLHVMHLRTWNLVDSGKIKIVVDLGLFFFAPLRSLKMSKVFFCVCVYSSILGGRVTLCPEWIKEASCDTAWKEHGVRQRERSLYSPKKQRRQGQEAKTIQSTHHRQWPSSCSKQDQGDRWEAKPVQPVQAVNSTLLSTQLISLSCCSSMNHGKCRADAKTKMTRGGSKDTFTKFLEQMLFDGRKKRKSQGPLMRGT